MALYNTPSKTNWSGRQSEQKLYVHEKVAFSTLQELEARPQQFVILGYACDEGVLLNQGRIGAKKGPEVIRAALAKMPNHLSDKQHLIDVGDIEFTTGNLTEIQNKLAKSVTSLLEKKALPLLIGGGHDIAYGHFNGIKNYLNSIDKKSTIGIINFDAHFDLRENSKGANSGTPFYQIASENDSFEYLCLGIRKDANDKLLFKTAAELGVTYVLKDTFRIAFAKEIITWIKAFIAKVDYVYVTIDLDGFSSAYAPGVSAASPMGYAPDIVLECLDTILGSGKLISLDIAEMNPKYDLDGVTAKLAASLLHAVIHSEWL
ncbi:formimidoylglutamase [Croceivirga lutea]|uniref:formimidoylglutamase n=1 Tax=Croceivirga lutea TaxID=1775167 RepID=UPI00163B226D|nr:formimidoylglutamase [Croceivirga lutea]GGG41840.1 formimidoylglutamase [Croceivirga lutea]